MSLPAISIVVCREPDDEAPEVQVTATAYVGQLKDKLNTCIGTHMGMSPEDIAELPRMSLTTGRRVWSDVHTLSAIVQAVGGLADLRYGSLNVTLAAVDLRDPPRRSPDEEAELDRLRKLNEARVRDKARTRRQRPGKRLARR